MATNYYLGTTTARQQVVTVTPANVEVGDIFRLTLTLDDSSVITITFTATAATVANVTAGLTAAWNASLNPWVAAITAADNTTNLTLTADVAGVPFSLTTSTANGGAVDDQTLTAVVTT